MAVRDEREDDMGGWKKAQGGRKVVKATVRDQVKEGIGVTWQSISC